MTFPTTPILDDFNRADEGPPPSADWSSVTGIVGVVVSSNVAAPNGAGTSSAIYTAASYTDMEAYEDIPTLPSTNYTIGVFLRGQQVGSGATIDGYLVRTKPSTSEVLIDRVDNGALTRLVTQASVTFSAGYKIGGRIVGSAITAWVHDGSNWSQVASTTDSTYSGSGNIGIFGGSSAYRVDNFGGGEKSVGAVLAQHHRQQQGAIS